jgi:hypothetical protein
MKMAALLSLVLLASGCGLILGIEDANDGSGSGEPIDERDDAGPGQGGDDDGGGTDVPTNGLGVLCGPNHFDNGFDGGCPGGGLCVTGFADWFDPDGVNGVCTLECFGGDPVCVEGYQGPPEGEPVCIPTGEDPEGGSGMCGILCEGGDSNLGCPPEMPCLPFSDPQGAFIGSGCGSPFWLQSGPALR